MGRLEKAYIRFLLNLYEGLANIACLYSWMGRLFAFPVGLLILVTQPLVRIGTFFEALFCRNRPLGRAFFGALLSPITAIVASLGTGSAMLWYPKKTCEEFIYACKVRLKTPRA